MKTQMWLCAREAILKKFIYFSNCNTYHFKYFSKFGHFHSFDHMFGPNVFLKTGIGLGFEFIICLAVSQIGRYAY